MLFARNGSWHPCIVVLEVGLMSADAYANRLPQSSIWVSPTLLDKQYHSAVSVLRKYEIGCSKTAQAMHDLFHSMTDDRRRLR